MSGLQTSRAKAIRNIFKSWISGKKPNSREAFADEIALIKQHIKNRDDQNAYLAARHLLKQAPDLEYASYTAALGASKLGKFIEIPSLIEAAIVSKPKNLKYLMLRGNAYLKLGEFQKAYIDFQEMALISPEDPGVWKGLLKIRAKLKINLPPPRIFSVINDEISNAYNYRNWSSFDRQLAEMEQLEPITARYWQLQRDDLFMRVGDPGKEWALFHLECREADHELSFNAFCNMFNAFLKTGDVRKILNELQKFRLIYNRLCPIAYTPGVCALFVRNKYYEQCLAFLDKMNELLPNDDSKLSFQLKTYAYRWICREALGLKSTSSSPSPSHNELATALMKELMNTHHTGSASAFIVDKCVTCWEYAQKVGNQFLFDLRYDPDQIHVLQTNILNALTKKTPLSLLRIMDGESYGFMGNPHDERLTQLSNHIETLW